MPALKVMLIFPAEKRRLIKSIDCEALQRLGHWNSAEGLSENGDDIEGRRRGHTKTLAII